MFQHRRALLQISLLLAFATSLGAQPNLGLFSSHSDIGTILHPGSASFDAANDAYIITGSGDNTWFKSDDLQYVWKKVESPNAILSAEIAFPNPGGNAHRKAMLMIRQSLAPDSPYVDVARHGNGITSLQYRGEKGDVTREVQTSASGPPRLRLVKQGDFFYVLYAAADGQWQFSGASMRLPMQGTFYVGLGVCSHDKDVTEKAAFTHVQLTSNQASSEGTLFSTIETVPIASIDRRVVYTARARFDTPIWLPDNSGFLIHQNGHVLHVDARPASGEHGPGDILRWNGQPPATIDPSSAAKPGSDRSLSPDSKWTLSFIDIPGATGSGREVELLATPASAGDPRMLAKFWNIQGVAPTATWSPDSTKVAYVTYATLPSDATK